MSQRYEGELQRIFKINIADVARTYRIQLYIDALDEYGEEVAVDLVDFFEHAGALLSICFFYRHYPFIGLKNGDEICVEDKNLKDVLTYTASSVQNRILTIEVAGVLINDIAMKTSGNFQWMTLVVPKVLQLRKKRKHLASLEASIRKVPSKLGDLYKNLLDTIDKDDRLETLLMEWVCFATRPLPLEELRIAMVVDVDTSYTSIQQCKNTPEYAETNEDMEKRICDLSRGLAEVGNHGGERAVQLIHQSIKDSLLDRGFQLLGNLTAAEVSQPAARRNRCRGKFERRLWSNSTGIGSSWMPRDGSQAATRPSRRRGKFETTIWSNTTA